MTSAAFVFGNPLRKPRGGLEDGPPPLPVPVREGCEYKLPQSAVPQWLQGTGRQGPSRFCITRQGSTVVLGLQSSNAGFFVVVLQTGWSGGLLHGWAGLQTGFVVGVSGSSADLLNFGFRRDVLLVVLLNFISARVDLWVACLNSVPARVNLRVALALRLTLSLFLTPQMASQA
ncbi:hypothetical protein CRENBAI_022063 [Crenichthys baileyi]|uniref:Uncharacterized protein n=1 Tax=Crenichthys baileyi TaxID=28760 RepID=A0AAV9SKF3_9TELE